MKHNNNSRKNMKEDSSSSKDGQNVDQVKYNAILNKIEQPKTKSDGTLKTTLTTTESLHWTYQIK